MKSTKNIFFTLFVSTLVLLLVFNNVSSQQTAGELYEKALFMEEAKGDLQKAIDLYQKILKQFPENREIASQAQLHIGLCYEKLGLKEAQKAYQKVVDNYPEQTEAVKVAKEKLAVLLRAQAVVEKGDKEFKIRQVWSGPEVDVQGAPSPDGRYLSYVDWETDDLAILEIATGKKRRLTKNGPWFESTGLALYSTWSPDGKQVAYAWFNGDNFIDLCIIGLDGSEPRVLYRNEEMEYVHPFDWSPDGKHILADFTKKDGTNQIVLVTAANGSVRVLKTLDWGSTWTMSFSPDGCYIVYDFPPKEGAPERDIFLLYTDGSREIPLIEHPADDFVLGWAPDGKSILFASDRTGTMDAWVIQVADGKPQGAPKRVKTDIGTVFLPMGFTQKGSFYYGLVTAMVDIYIATLDLEKGEILSPPTKATQRFIGSNFSPDWSPDGQYLAYLSDRGPGSGGLGSRVLCIRSMETGEVRELFPQLTSFRRLRWSPDGRSILVSGSDKNDRRGLYIIDTQTGDITLIVQSEPGAIIKHSAWSHDGKAIFYPYTLWTKKLSRILLRDLETGQDRELYRKVAPPDIGSLTLSPNGKQLAFLTADTETPALVLRVIPAAGGKSRDLLRVLPEQITSYAWTADGREILFAKGLSSVQKQTCELWRIPAEGGEPQKLGLAMDRLGDLRVHPDGRRIVFTAGKQSAEIWVMENFLPEEKPQKKSKSQQ